MLRAAVFKLKFKVCGRYNVFTSVFYYVSYALCEKWTVSGQFTPCDAHIGLY